MASGNHFMPLPQIFFKEPFIQVDGNAFFSPKENVFLVIKSFLSVSGNHYLRYKKAYLKLLLQPFHFIFPIFLSLGTDFLFSRNSILLFIDFFRDFCETTLVLLVEVNFVASRDDFFLPFSDTPSIVSFIFLTDINVFLKWILHSVWQKPIFHLVESFFSHFTDTPGS